MSPDSLIIHRKRQFLFKVQFVESDFKYIYWCLNSVVEFLFLKVRLSDSVLCGIIMYQFE